LKLQRAYLLKGGIDVVIIMILQESDTAMKAEVKARNENYHLGTGRGEMTQQGTGKGIGRDWKVKDGTVIAGKRVEAESWMIMTEAGTGGDA
jgi:hypothetical protein